jgi:hypothetical protein
MRELTDRKQWGAQQCSLTPTRQVHTSAVDQRLEPSESPKDGSVKRPGRTARSMCALPIVVATALVAAALAATTGHAAPPPTSGTPLRTTASARAAEYTSAIVRICAGSHLFDGTHQMGTRSDALSIAHAIRVSTARRLTRITALPVPPELTRTSSRWISSQRRLAATFARTWVRIYDTIDAAQTPAQRATLAKRLEKLVHTPDPLKLAAERLELKLHVPDCTGGG